MTLSVRHHRSAYYPGQGFSNIRHAAYGATPDEAIVGCVKLFDLGLHPSAIYIQEVVDSRQCLNALTAQNTRSKT
jgi:hypothetical protein